MVSATAARDFVSGYVDAPESELMLKVVASILEVAIRLNYEMEFWLCRQ